MPKAADNTLYPDSVLGMLHTVHKWGQDKAAKNNASPGDQPILVHCSAGIGRTGTIIAIDHCRDLLKAHHKVDVLSVISDIRHDRCALVQHPLQFEFVHEACVKYAELHKAQFIVEESGASVGKVFGCREAEKQCQSVRRLNFFSFYLARAAIKQNQHRRHKWHPGRALAMRLAASKKRKPRSSASRRVSAEAAAPS